MRQTNMIVVLTRKNKELLSERKKMEEVVHGKTIQAENEVKKSEKLEREMEGVRNKAVRERTKHDLAVADLVKSKVVLDDRIRDLERKLEAAARLRMAYEHQNLALRDKLDALLIDYSDVVQQMYESHNLDVPSNLL
jgi:hypothetical protein